MSAEDIAIAVAMGWVIADAVLGLLKIITVDGEVKP